MSIGAAQKRVSGAESARKLLSMLLLFDGDRPTWTVPALAAALDLSMSSAYRYVALLREVGLLDSASENSYRVTDRVLGLARAAEAGRASLVEVALPVMTRVRDAIDETVLIAQRTGTSVYCVDRVESHQPVRLQFDRGQAMPLHAGSMARVLLAAMPAGDRDDYLAGVLPTLTPAQRAQVSPDALAKVRATGWTVSTGEVDAGIWGTAAAVVAGGEVIASIGTAGPEFRLDEQRRETARRLVTAAAREISANL